MPKEQRDAIRAEDTLYRRAAERLSGGKCTSEHTSVNRDANGDGAFVEVIMWVPKSALYPQPLDLDKMSRPS